jgi:hypothetical protein
MKPRHFARFSVVFALMACVAQGSAQEAALESVPNAATGAARCAVRQSPSGWWFVSPTGERFFSLGVCMFNQGWERYDPAKPSYAALQHYDRPEAWARASMTRLKDWNFTTIGGWSDYDTLRRLDDHEFWFTPVLHAGSTAGVPWFDMWDEKVIRRVEEVAAKTIAPLRDDRRVIGYYSDNELGWWNAVHWKMTLEQPATSGQRQRLVALVRDVYRDDWDALRRDFEPDNASSWQDLESRGMLWLRPGSNGIRTMRRFLGLTADRYYQLMRDTIRKLDPQALYLGDRYQSFYYPEVAAASRPYVDVSSTNLNANWNDGTFLHSYLDTLHELTGKPVLVSEFYMAAESNRSGNKNAFGSFPAVKTQTQRAAALSNTVHALARLPYVVGADWFQYYDEPPHGRTLDGEDFNFGLVDIHDRPYEEVTEAFAALQLSALKSAATERRSALDGVPPAPANPLADFTYLRALQDWDRQRGYVPPATKHPVGDLYICWSPEAIYLAAFVVDVVEPDYYRNKEIPHVDRAVWSVQIGDKEPITAHICGGMAPVVAGLPVRIESRSGVYHDVRCITAIEIPAAHLGRDRLEPGERFELTSSYSTHGRAYHMEWKGEYTLSE